MKNIFLAFVGLQLPVVLLQAEVEQAASLLRGSPVSAQSIETKTLWTFSEIRNNFLGQNV